MAPNELQRQFIECSEGAVLLQAPVGTGKTRSLVDRAATAVERGVPAERILCLTFTNRAAEQLRDRVLDRCSEPGGDVVVRTFHSLCASILRLEHERVGLPADFVVYDEADAMEVLLGLGRRPASGTEAAAAGESGYGDTDHSDQARRFFHTIQRAKSEVYSRRVDLDTVGARVAAALRPPERARYEAYRQELRAQRAVDFGDLVLLVRALFDTEADIRERWHDRFDMVQVDEMQDTHLSEYYVLRVLAKGSGNIALVGDFDQTIYEWRGSQPTRIIEQYRKDFGPVREFQFTHNYRATRTLIEASNAVAARYSKSEPVIAAPDMDEGSAIVRHTAATPADEARWIGETIERLRRTGDGSGRSIPYNRMAVLVRANYRAANISDVFTQMGVPHVTVEEFEFFRRQEVKDALAHMRFLLNPSDTYALRRLLQRPTQGIGAKTVAAVEGAYADGLRLVDMVQPATLQYDDPHGALLEAFDSGSIIVFDTETTGLVPGEDEIIEIGAMKLEQGRVTGEFHRLLRNTVPVGDSEKVHHISDERLREEGIDPKRALREFAKFASGSVLVGHNVMFDVRMLHAAAEMHEVPVDVGERADTWELARRFIGGEGLALEKLAERYDLTPPSHRAMDDVRTTVELLAKLMPFVQAGAGARRGIVQRHRRAFEPVAERLARYEARIGRQRPAALLQHVVEDSGLLDHYAREPQRVQNLEELPSVFARYDMDEMPSRAALEAVVQFAALARNIDQLDDDVDKVRIVTVHSSKGLEFDAVFVAGMCEYEFPSGPVIRSGDFTEEWRVFYVAVTRARKRLYLSNYSRNDRGRETTPSRFLEAIPF